MLRNKFKWFTNFVVLSNYVADIKTIICQPEKIPFLIENSKEYPHLRTIIKIGDDVTDDEKKEAKQHRIELLSFAELEVIMTSPAHSHGARGGNTHTWLNTGKTNI